MIQPARGEPPDIRLVEQVVKHIFSSSFAIERVKEGVSTYVYRIHCASGVFYLRLLPEIDASFAPEVYIHNLLRAKKVKVPEIIYFEHYNDTLELSLIVMTEVRGESLSNTVEVGDIGSILIEAGRELAIINSLPVRHFGWIIRGKPVVTSLEAEHPTHRAFIYEYLESDLALLLEKQLLTHCEIARIRALLSQHQSWLNDEQAWLAHGDFDITHIYQEQGRYTGIIDFGEIRGTNRFYDLGLFRMLNSKTLYRYLLQGYKDVATLPLDYEQQVSFSGLLTTIRILERTVRKYSQDTPMKYSAYVRDCLSALRRELDFLTKSA